MGKQINFYMSDEVQKNFLEYLKQNKFQFLNYNFEMVDDPLAITVFDMYLYKSEYGEITVNKDNTLIYIDTTKSPVIEFCKTVFVEKENKVLRGRLWMEDCYYNEEGVIIKKRNAFSSDYQKLVRWIKKNVPYQNCKKGDYLIKEYINSEIIELQEQGNVLTI